MEAVDEIREELVDGIRQCEAEQRKEEGFTITKEAMSRRQSAPTGTPNCKESSSKQRRQETIKAACAIHGGSLDGTVPATIGMVETLEKKCKEKDVLAAMGKCRKIRNKVLPKIYKEDLVQFESSNENMLRSIAVYYSSGIMGRDKYRSVYKASLYRKVSKKKRAVRIKVENCPTPKLVPYHRLMSYIKFIEVGKLPMFGKSYVIDWTKMRK